MRLNNILEKRGKIRKENLVYFEFLLKPGVFAYLVLYYFIF